MSNKNKIFFITLSLCLIGLLMIYSASNIVALDKYKDSFYFFKRQSLFFLFGLIIMFVTSKIDYHSYINHSKKLLLFGYLLLIWVLIPGIGQVRGGSQSWYSLGPFSFQPSELFKIFIIFYLSNHLSKNYHRTKKIKYIILPLFSILLGFGLIMLQPDFGSGFIMTGSGIILIFISLLPLYFFMFLGLLGILGALLLIIIAPYRLKRLLSFLDPFSDPLGSGFQAIQSLYAIGPGGILGVGFNNSIQKHFYLPEPQTDFIFAILSEEFGLIGSIFTIFLFYKLFQTGTKIALQAKDLQGYYLAMGCTCLISLQTIVNLCVVTGLFPVTGVTLPFISYGGSSLVVTMMCIGIIMNIAKK